MTPEQERNAHQRRAMRRRLAMLLTALAAFPAFKVATALTSDEFKAELAANHGGMILGLGIGVLVFLGVMALMTRLMPLSEDERAVQRG